MSTTATPSAPALEVSAPPEPQPRAAVEVVSRRNEWDLVRKLAARQLERFIALEPKVLRGDPDAIHDMRVASRRLQQAVDLLYPSPSPKGVRKLRRVIRRSRHWLSEIRNCDALLESVTARLARKRTARREVWTAVEQYLIQRRAESFDGAQRKISKMNLAVFYLDLRGYLAAKGAKPDASSPTSLDGETPVLGPEQFYERIRQALERSAQALEKQIAESRKDPRAEVIHAARIATKRLRYLIEVIREFSVPGSNESLAWLRDLQKHLGDWHDLEVLEHLMIEMVARPKFLRDHLEIAMGVQKLMVQNRKTKKGLEEKYFLMTVDSPEFLQMKEWLAYLLSSTSTAFAKA